MAPTRTPEEAIPAFPLHLTRRDQEALLHALLDPPMPTEELVKAYRRYVREVDSR